MNRNNRTYEKCGSVLLREIKSVAVIKSKEVMGVFSGLLAGVQMQGQLSSLGSGSSGRLKSLIHTTLKYSEGT